MGTSNRHRKQKNKDFAKPKLRVGKTAPKNANFTDTSFKAKSISVTQKRTLKYSEGDDGLTKKLSVVRKPSQNNNARKEILGELVHAVSKDYDHVAASMEEILKVSCFLLLDSSRKIRELNLELWKALLDGGRVNIIMLHLDQLLLFINSGMTHIGNGIRLDSIKYLDCLLANQELQSLIVRSSWYKLLKNYMILMNWTSAGPDGARKNLVIRQDSSDLRQKDLAKDRIEQLKILAKLLKAGCFEEAQQGTLDSAVQIHPYTRYYMVQFDKPNPYGGLRLFTDATATVSSDVSFESISTDDVGNRRKVLCEAFGHGLREGLLELSKDENRELVNKSAALLEEYEQIKQAYVDAGNI